MESPEKVKTGLALLSIGAIFLTSIGAPKHDYQHYIVHWSAILQGSDPWTFPEGVPTNAYGPLYNALAFLYAINPFAPKVFFCITWLVASYYIVNIIFRKFEKENLIILAGILALFLNPFFWILIVSYGSMDILPAVFSLSAIVFRIQRSFILSGAMLGIGVLFKYYPIVLLPFLMIDNRRFQFSLMLSCLGTILFGLLISFAVWGMSTFSPVLFAASRHSKLLSIFRFLRGDYSPLHLFADNPNLDAYSFPAMILFLSIVLYFVWNRKIETPLAAILGFMTALTFYKVGHHQFYTAIFFMVPLWYTHSNLPEPYKNKVLLPLCVFLIWMIILILAFFSTKGQGPWPIKSFLASTIGLPTFILAVWSITAGIYYGGCIDLASSKNDSPAKESSHKWLG